MNPTLDRPASLLPWLPCLAVFVVALGIRLYFMSLIPEDALSPSTDWELDSIAMSLVRERQFANPYAEPTGPTAHLPPIPPLSLALIYEVFGITLLGGIVAWVIRIVFQSAIWGLLPWIGERTGLGWKAGLTGGLAGALFPQWLAHGEALAAVLMGLLAVAVARRWDRLAARGWSIGQESVAQRDTGPGSASSLLLGVAFGVSFHVQPVFLTVLLGYLAFELWKRRDRLRWGSAGLMLLGASVVSIPWGIRNYWAFDAVFFVRSNLGLELRMGNHEGATANIDDPHFLQWPGHPRTHSEEAFKVRELGEVPYMRAAGREAATWIRSHPKEFTRLTAQRIRYFWLGPLDHPWVAVLFLTLAGLASLGVVIALRQLSVSRSAALLIPLLAYPPIYYLVPWQHRYRFPIEWILFLLAGAALWSRGRQGESPAPLRLGRPQWRGQDSHSHGIAPGGS